MERLHNHPPPCDARRDANGARFTRARNEEIGISHSRLPNHLNKISDIKFNRFLIGINSHLFRSRTKFTRWQRLLLMQREIYWSSHNWTNRLLLSHIIYIHISSFQFSMISVVFCVSLFENYLRFSFRPLSFHYSHTSTLYPFDSTKVL